MAKAICIGVRLVLVAALVMAGCTRTQSKDDPDDQPDKPGKPDQATPKDALFKLADGMMTRDREKVMSCLTGTQEAKAGPVAFIDYLCAAHEFKQAVIKAWGQQGWKPFTTSPGVKLSVDLEDKRKEFDRMKITVRDNRAECTMPDDPQVIHVTRTGERWYIHAEDIMPVNPQQAKLWRRLSKMLQEKKSRPGQPGVTPQSLDIEVGQAFKRIAQGD